MGEYADEAVARLCGEDGYFNRRIRQARSKEERLIRARIAHQEALDEIEDELPDLSDAED